MRFLQLVFTLALSAGGFIGFAQDHTGTARLNMDSTLAPFYHGVASGDPQSDRVIIWTRITTQQSGTQNVEWKVATDTSFTNVIAQGTTTTDATKDYTVKVDATGLQPATYYYYRFVAQGKNSITGRTKTAPSSGATHIRFGVVSCSDYQAGYFNAYESLMLRNDIDAVIHLGDYIYEYEANSTLPGRNHEPSNETVTLEDYNARYSHYRLDPQLMKLHQQYPFIAVWDDHEAADNAWVGGAANHTDSTEGDWNVRKGNAANAYFNWMPIREQASPNERKVQRSVTYGNLAELIFLETRVENRPVPSEDPATLLDTTRSMLGATQYAWLMDRLYNSPAKWKIVAQQTMMAPLTVANNILNYDQWDGFPYERGKIYSTILNDSLKNIVVLSGDIHCAFANNLDYGPSHLPVAVEFVATSITSPGFPTGVGEGVLQTDNSHMEYANINEHGYLILDITETQAQSDFFFVDDVESINLTTELKASYFTLAGIPILTEGTEAAGLSNVAPFAPLPASLTGIKSTQETDVVILGSYPNPFDAEIMVQYYSPTAKPVTATMFDMAGKQVFRKNLGNLQGVNYTKLDVANLQSGAYVLILDNGVTTFRKTINKVR